jgi:hypothetical protein
VESDVAHTNDNILSNEDFFMIKSFQEPAGGLVAVETSVPPSFGDGRASDAELMELAWLVELFSQPTSANWAVTVVANMDNLNALIDSILSFRCSNALCS